LLTGSAPATLPRMHAIHSLEHLQRAVAVERATIVDHELYERLVALDDVRVFMEHHVFAVWDFMSLVKRLQRDLTCVEVPWIPRGEPLARRLLNEIVLGEESDDAVGGGYASHFELYRAAMLECGADIARIDAFVERIGRGEAVRDALDGAAVPQAARRFVAQTFTTIESGSLPRIAAAFTLGREELIPEMFTPLIEDISRRSGARLGRLLDYLERHVRIDGERHGPMAARLLQYLCGDDPLLWKAAELGAREAICARRVFWDEICTELAQRNTQAHVAARSE
jgi:hypothetical protein